MVAALNQEKALVGAFSVIVQLRRFIVNSTRYNQVRVVQQRVSCGSVGTDASTANR